MLLDGVFACCLPLSWFEALLVDRNPAVEDSDAFELENRLTFAGCGAAGGVAAVTPNENTGFDGEATGVVEDGKLVDCNLLAARNVMELG